ncbi:MAG: hypothetical protein ACJ8JD_07730 [Chthoniobacterales bacterium]
MRELVSLITLFLLTLVALAQEPALPSNSPLPETSPSASPDASAPQLIPAAPVAPVLPSAPPVPDISQLDAAFKQTPLGQAAEEYRLHVEWRKLQNRVEDDPDVIAAHKAANGARTDLEKRELLRAYYKLYYDRMAALASAPDVKAYVQNQKNAHLGSTAQDKVRPSATPGAKTPTPAGTTPTPTPVPTPTPLVIP